MFGGLKLHDVPARAVAGTYILHEGLGKWNANQERAQALHSMASGAFPIFKDMNPKQFTTLLSAAELATGAVLLAPIVPTALAGLALTGFAGGLVTLYARTPALRRPGSIWPSQNGVAISKDSWLLALGSGLVLDAIGRRSGRQRRAVARAAREMVRRDEVAADPA